MKPLTNLLKNSWCNVFALLITCSLLTTAVHAQTQGTGVATVTADGGSCLDYTPSQSGGPDNWEVAEGGSYTMTITGVTECSDGTITVFIQSSNSGNFCFDATGSNGTYSGSFTLPEVTCYTMPISYKCGAGQSCDNSNTFNANGPSNTGSVHLRASNFDGSCVRTGEDEECDPEDLPPTIDCSTIGDELGCNPATSVPEADDNAPIVDGGCFPVVVTHGQDVEDINGCVHTITRTYTATDDCGQTATCDQVFTYSVASALAFDNLPAGGTISGCNPEPPSCDNGVTASNECGTVSASCTAGEIVSDGCTRSQTFSYHASTSCGADADADVTYTWSVSTDVTIEADGPVSICSGNCVQLNATQGFTTYQWYFNGNLIQDENESSISACESGTYSVTATNDCSCESASNEITVTVYETPSCNLDPLEGDELPVANTNDNVLCAEVSGGSDNTYVWTLTSSDGSWTINPGTEDDLCVTYHCGTFGSSATFTFTVTSHYGNLSCAGESCTISITTEAHEQCSYTQGFYGQSIGVTSCTGVPAPQAIAQALSTGNINIGAPSGAKRMVIANNTTQIGCLTTRLPAVSSPAVLTNAPVSVGGYWTPCNYTNLQSNKFKNVLLGQTITLALNTRLFPELLGYHLTTSTFTTYTTTDCDPETDDVVPNSGQTFTIPQSVINCLGSNSTTNKVSNLLALANKALGGQPLACVSPASQTATAAFLADINAAVDAVNRGFDKCRIISGYNIREQATSISGGNSELALVVYPNPSNGNASVEFVSGPAAKATVDVLNISGSLMYNLYDTEVAEGSTNRVNFSTTDWAPGIYFIRLNVGGQEAFTKIVVIK